MRYRLTPTEGSPSPSEPITFTTRTGTRRGVTSAQWRVETPRDLATWSRAVVQATHAAVADMQQLVFGEWTRPEVVECGMIGVKYGDGEAGDGLLRWYAVVLSRC